MTEVTVVQPIASVAPAAPRRTAWGAIFAGVAIALGTMILLELLGLGIGLATIDPASGDTPSGTTLGIGAAVWWLAVTVIALFAGGWVAGRLGGFARRENGALHGLVVWGLATVLMFTLALSAVGRLVGGAFGALGSAVEATGGAVAEVAGGAASGAGGALARGEGPSFEGIRDQALALLRGDGPDDVRGEPREASAPRQGETAAGDEQLLDSLQRTIRGEATREDRDQLADELAARTGTTREEAQQRIDRWTAEYQDTRRRAGETLEHAKEKGAEAVETTANALSMAAWWSFLALLLGGVAAAFGGRAGAQGRDDLDEVGRELGGEAARGTAGAGTPRR